MLVALKIAIAPVLILACTLVARRWGPAVGGWVLGLPLTSGPVSVLLFLERGPNFARHAAGGTLLGLAAGAVFCVSYVLLAGGCRHSGTSDGNASQLRMERCNRFQRAHHAGPHDERTAPRSRAPESGPS